MIIFKDPTMLISNVANLISKGTDTFVLFTFTLFFSFDPDVYRKGQILSSYNVFL